MQKLINVLALASFGVSTVIVAGGGWVYVNRYKFVNDVKNIAADEIMDMVPDMMSGALKPPTAPIPFGGNTNSGGGASSSSPVSLPVMPFGG